MVANENSSLLFPEIEPFDTGFLSVSGDHKIYYEQSGNPEGIPIVFLHGGPGSGTKPKHRQLFDPALYRIILFDQRGAGQSTPPGHIQQNETRFLINDIEALRQNLNIEKWTVYGSSWGTTLGLCYAIAYPNRVLGMVLAGIFLAEKKGIQWLKHAGGAQRFFPMEFKEMLKALPKNERTDPEMGFYHAVTDARADKAAQSAMAMLKWEGALCGMEENLLAEKEAREKSAEDTPQEKPDETALLNFARIQTHYDAHHFFINEGHILSQAASLQNIPIFMVHGRYDLVCPLNNAWKLHQKLPQSHLTIVPKAGHSSTEMAAEIKAALTTLATQLKEKGHA